MRRPSTFPETTRGCEFVTTAPIVLVTGAAGLVGRAVVARLGRLPARVIPLVRAAPASGPGPAGDDVVVLDLAAEGADLAARVGATPDCVVHLAAAVPHAARTPDTDDSAAMTARMDRAVFDAAGAWGAHCVYASTCGLYDPRDERPKEESSALVPRSPYFRAKADGEQLFRSGPRCGIVRLSAPYGPGLQPMLVLRRFIETACEDGTLQVWGDGTREQDFISVTDIAEVVAAAVTREATGTYNVASGRAVTMVELARATVEAVGSGQWTRVDRPDPQDGWTARYAIGKAERELGWRPHVDLVDGLRDLARVERSPEP